MMRLKEASNETGDLELLQPLGEAMAANLETTVHSQPDRWARTATETVKEIRYVQETAFIFAGSAPAPELLHGGDGYLAIRRISRSRRWKRPSTASQCIYTAETPP
ncbi:MAG: hypothetical protein ACLU9S_18760 [Oscillospiraceae bacterium]